MFRDGEDVLAREEGAKSDEHKRDRRRMFLSTWEWRSPPGKRVRLCIITYVASDPVPREKALTHPHETARWKWCIIDV